MTSSSLPVSDSERSTSPDSYFVATSFPVAMSISPPRYVSFTWELDAASDFEFLLILLSGFPLSLSIPGLLDAIGLFADEELFETLDRFIAVEFDFATLLFLDKVHVVIVMENDTWETQEWMEPQFALHAAIWQSHLSSSGQFLMMSRWSHSNQRVQMVAHSGWERMVAHNFTDVGLLSTKWWDCRSLLKADVSFVVCLTGPFVVPIDEMQVKPHHMMAALIIWS